MRYNTSDSLRSHMMKTVMLVYFWGLLWSPGPKIGQKEAKKAVFAPKSRKSNLVTLYCAKASGMAN